MIVLSTLNKLLAQVLSPPSIHTAVVFTTAGDLISFAVLHPSPKDDVRVLVGFSSEIWSESKHDGGAMVDSEVSYNASSSFAKYIFTQKEEGEKFRRANA